MNVSLQIKILVGYVILMAVIGSMTVILLYERQRMREIETETSEIRRVRRDINMVRRHIVELATRGESIVVWEEADYLAYRQSRLLTDSLLQALKPRCEAYVRPDQIDTLRCLLADKESHLRRLMHDIERQGERDSLLINHLPGVARRATRIRTVRRKKDGVAGLFGGKKTVQVLPSAEELHAFSDSLIAMQARREREMATYADDLRGQNRELNERLYTFITYLDVQVQTAFRSREEKIAEARGLSYRLFAVVISSASVLLVVSFLVIRYDIRKEGRHNAQLQRINRENEDLLEMRKQVILTVSHDIRGPLGNINNCAELASDTREKRKREVYLGNIRHSCRHILNLVNNLMDVYKINEARNTRNDVPFRLDRLLASISEEYARKAADRALLFEGEHGVSDGVTVSGDADKLEQILDNLLTNAVKFTPSGTIGFRSGYAGGKLSVEISDTGIGMDEETAERVFRPFERAAQEVNSEGFGLGLFITKGLVKVLDGNIGVESRPGKGTVFRLTFPLPETTEEAETEALPVPVSLLLPKRVLVVDDDSILLKIAEDMLGRNGVECTTCLNVKEVVAALGRSAYDLVLTDIQMPMTDGFGLLKLLRGSDIGNSRTVPVAVMTARGDGDSGVYVKSGFCGCIHKPFTMKGLLAFISSVTGEYATGGRTFDYDRLLENTDDRRQMFALVVKESEKDLAELGRALEKTDRESMRKTVHRMMPVWELLGAGDILSAYRRVLHDKAAGDDTVVEHTRRIMGLIRGLVDEVRKKLKQEEKDDEKENTGC